jgi:hypothetical protein
MEPKLMLNQYEWLHVFGGTGNKIDELLKQTYIQQ